jgi:hypothetical protein
MIMFFSEKANLFKYMLPQSKGNLFFPQAGKKKPSRQMAFFQRSS